jgi:hypothetical protein
VYGRSITTKKVCKSQQSSEREWPNPRNTSHANPRNIFGLDGENAQENPNPQGDSQNQTPSLPSPPHSNQGGTEAEGAAAEVEVAAKAEATTRKENGIASSIRRMTIIVQITAQTRKDSRLFLKKGRRRRGLVP